MANENNAAETRGDNEVLIKHISKAPIGLVFESWTNRAYLERWFAPDDCTVEYRELNVMTGGTFHMCIYNPHHGECWCVGTYLELIENEKIVYEIINADENGTPIDPASIGMDPEWPGSTVVTVTFSEVNGGTEIVLHQTVSEALAKRTGAHPSWIQMLERLDQIIAV